MAVRRKLQLGLGLALMTAMGAVGHAALGGPPASGSALHQPRARAASQVCCTVTAHCTDGRFVMSTKFCEETRDAAEQRARNDAYATCADEVLTYNYNCE